MPESKQSEQLITSWVQTQQRLLTSWLETARSAGGTPSSTLWNDTLEAWHTSAQQTLDAQARWIHSWAESLTALQGTSTEMGALVSQGEERLQHWIQAQRQLWQNWFELLKQFTPTREPATGVPAGQQAVQTWQELTAKMIEAQTEWARRWMAALTGNTSSSQQR